MNFSAQNLLIVHPGALGDGLLARPALRLLRISFPGHRLIWFGHRELGDALVSAGEVHQSYSFDTLNYLAYQGMKDSPYEKFLSIIRRCDKAIGWLEDAEGIWRSWLNAAGIQDCILRSPHDMTLLNHHMADRYVEILQPWIQVARFLCDREKSRTLAVPLVFPRSHSGRPPYPDQKPLIVLHPGSGSRSKCTSPVLLASIVKGLMLAKPKWNICLVGGPADNDALRNLQGLLTHLDFAVLKGMDLLQIADYMQHAQLFIGHDSGLSHLAASLGVPSVLLFGPTDPGRWAPRGTHVAVLRKSCHCLGKASISRCSEMPCLSFSQDEVLENVDKVLGRVKGAVASTSFECIDEAFTMPCLG